MFFLYKICPETGRSKGPKCHTLYTNITGQFFYLIALLHIKIPSSKKEKGILKSSFSTIFISL